MFALRYVMGRRKEVVGMPFHEWVERSLPDIPEAGCMQLVQFFASFEHNGKRGFTQGLVGLVKCFPSLRVDLIRQLIANGVWFPLHAIAQIPECDALIMTHLPPWKPSESQGLRELRGALLN